MFAINVFRHDYVIEFKGEFKCDKLIQFDVMSISLFRENL